MRLTGNTSFWPNLYVRLWLYNSSYVSSNRSSVTIFGVGMVVTWGVVIVGRGVGMVVGGRGWVGCCSAGDEPDFKYGIPTKNTAATTVSITTTPIIIAAFLGRVFFPADGGREACVTGIRRGDGGGGWSPGNGAGISEISCAAPQYSQNFWLAGISFPHEEQNGIKYH